MQKKNIFYIIVLIAASFFFGSTIPAQESELPDPWLWLEQVDGINALAWVNGQNARTARELKSKPEFDSLYKQGLETLNSASRIPSISQRGKWLYNLWQDPQHPRGIYRRTSMDEFRKQDPNWETVLDIDALSQNDNKAWVFRGIDCLSPEYSHCLVSLAAGGTDASEIREFDMDKLSFVSNGFFLPTSKSSATWIDADTLFVEPDLGKDSVTESGYPRNVKVWKRGTSITDANKIHEASVKSVSASGYRIRTAAGDIDIVNERPTFWSGIYYQLIDGRMNKLHLPETAVIEGGYSGKLVVSLKEDWEIGDKKFVEGSVIIAEPAALRENNGAVDLLVAPTATEIVENVATAKSGILIETLDSVRGRLYRYQPEGSSWKRQNVPLPDNGAIDIASVDDDSGDFFVQFESFTTPPALYYVQTGNLNPEKMKTQEATFDGANFDVQQLWTTSQDGARVPYFIVMKKGTRLDGKNPTHIFSYGGFRNSLTPSYSGSYEKLSGAYGKLWLERGGVFVLANIRGGGEFGPAWHRAALRENRHKSFEDFEAIARDLVTRKITSPKHIGIEGRSNGGLLVMALMIRHPELYGAIICGSPLVDMLRYQYLLAGASWVAEYGNPDLPEDRKFIATYSPYQFLRKDQNYPPVFFYASARDDRVHPGHARKTVARLIELGYTDTLYYENTEGGHGASSTNEQLAYRLALAYTHLWERLR